MTIATDPRDSVREPFARHGYVLFPEVLDADLIREMLDGAVGW